MGCRTVRIGDVASFRKESIKPVAGVTYRCYSLPAFDNAKTPEVLDGSEILSNKLRIDAGDILVNKLNMRFKRIWPVDKLLPNSVCSTEFVPLCPKGNIDRNYLLYILLSDDFTRQLSGMRTGTSGSHQRVKPEWILDYHFELPDETLQQRIGSILSSIDAKVAANSKLNGYLVELVKALFNRWFKDFAPFAGEETHASEIGEIPISVNLVPLADLTKTITKGTTPTTLGFEYKESGINFIKGESILDNHSFDYGKFAHIDDEANGALKRSIIEDRDLLFTIAGTLGRFAMVEQGMLPANTNQAVGIIRVNDKVLSPEVLLSYFIGSWQEDYYARRVQQAVQANLSLTTLKSLPVPVLKGQKRAEYEAQVLPIISAFEANNTENRKLAKIRDALLPKLMSGEIDVSKVALTQLNSHLA